MIHTASTPRLLRTAFLAAALALPGAAQNPRLQIQGLEKLSAHASEVVDITLEGPALKMAARFLGDDPDTRAVVQGIKGIFVKSFEFDKADSYAPADVDAILAQLQGPGWSRIVGVQEKKDKQRVGVYLMADAAGNPLGLAVLAAEAKELTVVNIVGAIDLDKLSSLEGKFGIPKLQDGKKDKVKAVAHEAR